MKYSLFSLFFGISVLLSACSNENNQAEDVDLLEASPTKEEVHSIAFEDLFNLKLDGKLVEVEGYVALPRFAMFVDGGKGKLEFGRIPKRNLGPDADLLVEMGDCENCLKELPDHYGPDDLILKAADGTLIHAYDRVKVKGRLSVKKKEERDDLDVEIEVEKVEKVADRDFQEAMRSAVAITKDNLMDSTLAYQVVKAKGLLSLPSMVFMSDEIGLSMKLEDEYLSASFLIGDGPNQVERLPENFSPKDLKVHDHEGKLLDWRKPVWIYGYRSMPESHYSGSVEVEWVEQAKE